MIYYCASVWRTPSTTGQEGQVQRVAPAHYMAFWVDLPGTVANLRYVPEMIVAMLADQKGDRIERNKTWKASVRRGQRFRKECSAARTFHQGITRRDEPGEPSSLRSDRFDEETPVGLDQLLMIRLAKQLGEAPAKLRGKEEDVRISNQRPIAEKAARHFSEDIRRFVHSYASFGIPRHTFVELLESCMAVGMTTILTSVIEMLFAWSESGVIQKACEQEPASLFVDCSNGVAGQLRTLAEQSFDDFMRRTERFPVVLMALRLLDWSARYDRKIKTLGIRTTPFATEWLNMLGELLHERRPEARPILYSLEQKAEELADRLKEDYPESAQILLNSGSQPNPVFASPSHSPRCRAARAHRAT